MIDVSEQKSLIKKLAQVMTQVKYIEKRGFNNFNKYKYATEADVNEKVREYLAEQNVMLIPNMKSHTVREHQNRKGNTEYIVTAEVEFTFYDGDTGESLSFTIYGEGQDAGDKATYKAITGAQKYALMKSFMIPTGDDPEQDEKPQQEKKETPLTTLKAKWQTLAGDLNGFDDWHKAQADKGITNNQMNVMLTKKLKEKQKEEKAS